MSIVKVNYLRLLCCKESNARFYDRRKSNEFLLRWIQNTSYNRSSSLGEDGFIFAIDNLEDDAEVDSTSSLVSVAKESHESVRDPQGSYSVLSFEE